MSAGGEQRLNRRTLLADVLAARGDGLAIAGLGSPAWDLAAAGDRPDNFYMWGGMGQAVPIGLGLALLRPDRRVLVVTGDGEMMMGIGSLAVVAAERPGNLAVLVLDNELFGETGNQAGLTAAGTDLVAMARGAGIGQTLAVRAAEELPALMTLLWRTPGPVFASVKIARGEDQPVYPSSDGAFLAQRMRRAVAGN